MGARKEQLLRSSFFSMKRLNSVWSVKKNRRRRERETEEKKERERGKGRETACNCIADNSNPHLDALIGRQRNKNQKSGKLIWEKKLLFSDYSDIVHIIWSFYIVRY